MTPKKQRDADSEFNPLEETLLSIGLGTGITEEDIKIADERAKKYQMYISSSSHAKRTKFEPGEAFYFEHLNRKKIKEPCLTQFIYYSEEETKRFREVLDKIIKDERGRKTKYIEGSIFQDGLILQLFDKLNARTIEDSKDSYQEVIKKAETNFHQFINATLDSLVGRATRSSTIPVYAANDGEVTEEILNHFGYNPSGYQSTIDDEARAAVNLGMYWFDDHEKTFPIIGATIRIKMGIEDKASNNICDLVNRYRKYNTRTSQGKTAPFLISKYDMDIPDYFGMSFIVREKHSFERDTEDVISKITQSGRFIKLREKTSTSYAAKGKERPMMNHVVLFDKKTSNLHEIKLFYKNSAIADRIGPDNHRVYKIRQRQQHIKQHGPLYTDFEKAFVMFSKQLKADWLGAYPPYSERQTHNIRGRSGWLSQRKEILLDRLKTLYSNRYTQFTDKGIDRLSTGVINQKTRKRIKYIECPLDKDDPDYWEPVRKKDCGLIITGMIKQYLDGLASELEYKLNEPLENGFILNPKEISNIINPARIYPDLDEAICSEIENFYERTRLRNIVEVYEPFRNVYEMVEKFDGLSKSSLNSSTADKTSDMYLLFRDNIINNAKSIKSIIENNNKKAYEVLEKETNNSKYKHKIELLKTRIDDYSKKVDKMIDRKESELVYHVEIRRAEYFIKLLDSSSDENVEEKKQALHLTESAKDDLNSIYIQLNNLSILSRSESDRGRRVLQELQDHIEYISHITNS